jgi:tetratricopeptide (TPR) repeat protein
MPPSESPSIGQARSALAAGEVAQALNLLEQAEREHPLAADVQRLLCTAYSAANEPVKAAASALAAQALEQGSALQLYNLATGYMQHGQSELAKKWYRTTLLLDPALSIAHQNLAALLFEAGEFSQARVHREQAYQLQWIFVERTPAAAATVLLPSASDVGNVPTRYLLPSEEYSTIRALVEYAREPELSCLPEHDLVFNAIGDPDCAAAGHPSLEQVLSASNRPVLNTPGAVQATRRDRLGALLNGLDGVIVPRVDRIEVQTGKGHPIADRLRDRGAQFPLILRRAKSHGGQGACLVDTPQSALSWARAGDAENQTEVVYATAFWENRDARHFYRKYRVIYVDGQAFPYHLAISRSWLVHYFSAEMGEAAWKLEEEQRFLADPQTALGNPAWETVGAIGRRLGLDYAGLDFTILDTGAILVFEANATMLVHPEPDDGPFAYKNVAIRNICSAFKRMLSERMRS